MDIGKLKKEMVSNIICLSNPHITILGASNIAASHLNEHICPECILCHNTGQGCHSGHEEGLVVEREEDTAQGCHR